MVWYNFTIAYRNKNPNAKKLLVSIIFACIFLKILMLYLPPSPALGVTKNSINSFPAIYFILIFHSKLNIILRESVIPYPIGAV